MAFVAGIGIVVAMVALLLLAAALSKVRIRVRYARSGAQDRLVVIVRALYGAYRYRVTVPSVMIRGKDILFEKKAAAQISGKSKLSRLARRKGRTLLKYGRQMLPWMKQALKKVECTRLRLDFRVGTGDAASTAVASGALWSVYGCAIALASECIQMKTSPHGAVQPVYEGKEFSVVAEADLHIRVGSFIGTLLFSGIKMTALFKSWNHWRHWMNGPQHT